ncbi:hypothetical protein F0562_009238 [Nyssa sinensis]|uniref:AAA+ ATPase domain-containing protein n=1 Tax=Nyssa sinensis TaxID=561372 RepID=A0A5J4ZVN2_9ASTE|nr:hypothetical protein F0562_009238 [Nyssa sinensis]
MDGAVPISLVGKVIGCSTEPIGKQFGYLIHYNRNVENFRNEVKELESLRNGIQETIVAATRGGEQIHSNIKDWMERVDRFKLEAMSFLEKDANLNMKCFNGLLPNPITHCQISREAKKKIMVAAKLKEDGKFSNMSHPAPPIGIEFMSLGDYVPYKTTELAIMKVMEALKDDEINLIGIHGMGGVGKTTLVKEVSKRAIEDKLFDKVVMVVVSQTIDFKRIQGEIADMLGLKFTAESDIGRASQLCARLKEEINRILIILDDVWARLDVNAVVGRAMRNQGLKEWKMHVQELRKSVLTSMEGVNEEVFSCLKLSFDYLTDEAKSCFLLCSMFPKDCDIPIERLTRYGFGLRIFENVDTMQEARREVNYLVNNLTASCLLYDSDEKGCIKIHDVVRDVAISLGSNKYFVRAGVNLKEWPNIETLERYIGISLMGNRICELPGVLESPNLYILLLQGNLFERTSEFFNGMKALKVLDLSFNPNIGKDFSPSICYLTCLQTLILEGVHLWDTTFLGQITTLEVLSLRRSCFYESPTAIKQLTNLRLLDMSFCQHINPCPGVILPNVVSYLSRLEELYLLDSKIDCEVAPKLKSLSFLTVLTISIDTKELSEDFTFPDLEIFIIVLATTPAYRFGHSKPPNYLELNDLSRPIMWWQKFPKMLLKKIEHLELCYLENMKNIIPNLFIDEDDLSVLKTLKVSYCDAFEYLINRVEWGIPAQAQQHQQMLSNLEELELKCLKNFKGLCHGALPSKDFLSKLKKLKIGHCDYLSNLFQPSMARSLQQLEELEVSKCEEMGEIIMNEHERQGEEDEEMEFKNLTRMKLSFLPNLKAFCTGSILFKCPSLEELIVYKCPDMNTFTTTDFEVQSSPKLKAIKVDGIKIMLQGISLNTFMKSRYEVTIGEAIINEGHRVLTEEAMSWLLLCSLFPKDHDIPIEDLVRYGCGLRVFKPDDTVQKARSQAISLVNLCKDRRLLNDSNIRGCIKMHDAGHDVAKSIGSSICFVRAGVNFKEPPNMENLERYIGISLMGNQIRELPDIRISPTIQILLLQGNLLERTGEFFRQTKSIRVLDLSFNREIGKDLSSSIGHLTSFRTLILEGIELWDTTFLGQIKTLEVLSLRNSKFHESANAIKQLTNLRLLDMSFCQHINPCPGVILPNVVSYLSRLEELYLLDSKIDCEVAPKLKSLSFLTVLTISIDTKELSEDFTFPDLEIFIIVLATTPAYRFGHSKPPNYLELNDLSRPIMWWQKFPKMLLKKIEHLELCYLENMKNIIPNLFIDEDDLSVLKTLKVSYCDAFEYLINRVEWGIPAQAQQHQQMLSNLEELELKCLKNFKGLCHGALPSKDFLSKLKKLKIGHCDYLSNLFQPSMARSLQQLEELEVSKCEEMGEIIMNEHERQGEEDEEMEFKNLTRMKLSFLPNLKAFCTGSILFKCPSLEELIVYKCPDMNTFTTTDFEVQSSPKLKAIKVDGIKIMLQGISLNTFMKSRYEALAIINEGHRVLTEEAKSWLLLCSLFPKDHDIPIEDLVRYWCGLRVFKPDDTVQKARSQAISLVNLCKDRRLLTDSNIRGCIKMLGAGHDVAKSIGSRICFVRAGVNFKEPPNMENLERYIGISLMGNQIRELPDIRISPTIQILLLQGNLLERTGEFFRQTKSIRVLDLSFNREIGKDLSSSIRHLTSFRTLILEGIELWDTTFLGQIKTLEVLSLRNSKFHESANAIKQLTNLRLLDMSFCQHIDPCPGVILPNVVSCLSRLEELCLVGTKIDWKVGVELNSLPRLSVLTIWIHCTEQIPEDFIFPELESFIICLGSKSFHPTFYETPNYLELNGLVKSSIWKQKCQKLLKKTNHLCLNGLEDIKNILPDLFIDGDDLSVLKTLSVSSCGAFEYLINRSVGCGTPPQAHQHQHMLSNLEELRLENLENFKGFYHGALPSQFLSNLKKIEFRSLIALSQLTNLNA